MVCWETHTLRCCREWAGRSTTFFPRSLSKTRLCVLLKSLYVRLESLCSFKSGACCHIVVESSGSRVGPMAGRLGGNRANVHAAAAAAAARLGRQSTVVCGVQMVQLSLFVAPRMEFANAVLRWCISIPRHDVSLKHCPGPLAERTSLSVVTRVAFTQPSRGTLMQIHVSTSRISLLSRPLSLYQLMRSPPL